MRQQAVESRDGCLIDFKLTVLLFFLLHFHVTFLAIKPMHLLDLPEVPGIPVSFVFLMED